MDSSGWKVVILERSRGPSSKENHYRNAYQMWKKTWRQVFQSLGKNQPFYSDQFTRQDEVLALFYGDQCAGLSLFHRVDLSEKHFLDDSYFGVWPEKAVKKLIQNGTDILVCSYFTVAEEFRKDHVGISVKDLLLGLLVRYFLESGCDAMTGSLRNSKGINELCYRWGASPLMMAVPFNGEENDLVGFYAETVKPKGVPTLTKLLDKIWKERDQVTVKPGLKRAG